MLFYFLFFFSELCDISKLHWECWYLNRINIVTKQLKSQSTSCNLVPWTAQEALVPQSSSCYCALQHSGPAKRQSGTIRWEQVTSGWTKPSCQTDTQPWTDNSCLMASLPYFHLRWSKSWLVEHLHLVTFSGKKAISQLFSVSVINPSWDQLTFEGLKSLSF